MDFAPCNRKLAIFTRERITGLVGGRYRPYLRVDHIQAGPQLAENVHQAAVTARGGQHEGRLALPLVTINILSCR